MKKKNLSQPKPNGLNQKGNKVEEEAPNKKNKKNPSERKPDGLKPKTIKWKNKPKIKKHKRSIIA